MKVFSIMAVLIAALFALVCAGCGGSDNNIAPGPVTVDQVLTLDTGPEHPGEDLLSFRVKNEGALPLTVYIRVEWSKAKGGVDPWHPLVSARYGDVEVSNQVLGDYDGYHYIMGSVTCDDVSLGAPADAVFDLVGFPMEFGPYETKVFFVGISKVAVDK